jgi:hypothetical protein
VPAAAGSRKAVPKPRATGAAKQLIGFEWLDSQPDAVPERTGFREHLPSECYWLLEPDGDLHATEQFPTALGLHYDCYRLELDVRLMKLLYLRQLNAKNKVRDVVRLHVVNFVLIHAFLRASGDLISQLLYSSSFCFSTNTGFGNSSKRFGNST